MDMLKFDRVVRKQDDYHVFYDIACKLSKDRDADRT